MAPASVLDWSEPRQNWRCPRVTINNNSSNSDDKENKVLQTQSTVELNDKQVDTAYKRICKFLRRLGSSKKSKRECDRKQNDRFICI